jgi:hypothetical protein
MPALIRTTTVIDYAERGIKEKYIVVFSMKASVSIVV